LFPALNLFRLAQREYRDGVMSHTVE